MRYNTDIQPDYRWIITHDYVKDSDAKEGTNSNAKGIEGPRGCDEDLKSNPQKFSLYDDDGECYAEGMLYSTDEAYNTEVLFGPLDDYGRANWGCTDIKVDGEFLGGG
jgi:hypothetical protein